MTEFYARVELQGSPQAATYSRLHSTMSDMKYYTWNYPTVGKPINLPHATYRGDRPEGTTAHQAYAEVRKVLLNAGFTFKMVMVKAKDVYNPPSYDFETP